MSMILEWEDCFLAEVWSFLLDVSVCMTAVVSDASRQAGARLQLLPLSGRLSLGALQISLAFTSQVSGWLPPDLAAKPFNHRLPQRWTRSYVGDGRGPLIPIKVITQATATPDRPFFPWKQPISLLSVLFSQPADLEVREPSPDWFGSLHLWLRVGADACAGLPSATKAALITAPASTFQPLPLPPLPCWASPQRTLVGNLDPQLSTLKDLQPPTPSPHPAPTSELPSQSEGGVGVEGKRLMNKPFDTLLQAKGRGNWLNLDENYIKEVCSFAAMDPLHAPGSEESCTYVWSALDCDSELKGSTREQQIYMIPPPKKPSFDKPSDNTCTVF